MNMESKEPPHSVHLKKYLFIMSYQILSLSKEYSSSVSNQENLRTQYPSFFIISHFFIILIFYVDNSVKEFAFGMKLLRMKCDVCHLLYGCTETIHKLGCESVQFQTIRMETRTLQYVKKIRRYIMLTFNHIYVTDRFATSGPFQNRPDR